MSSKKIILFLGLNFMSIAAFTQVFLEEGFDEGQMPPSGWSIDEHEYGWFVMDFDKAGGEHPEARYTSISEVGYSGISRLISPSINLNGQESIILEYDNNLLQLYNYMSKYGIATKSNGTNWNTVMEETGSNSFSARHEVLIIDNEDVGSNNFQICFYVDQEANYLINEWNFDDIKIYAAKEHDIAVTNCLNKEQFTINENIVPVVNVLNCGDQTETFEIQCDLYNSNNQLLYTNTKIVNDLDSGSDSDIPFDGYTIPTNNELYRLIFTNLLTYDEYSQNDSLVFNLNTYTTAPQKVILEVGTGTWCPYCVGIALGADDLVTNGHDVAVVEYHYFDDYTTLQSINRVFYYYIVLYPTAIFNGIDSRLYGDVNDSKYEEMIPFVDNALEKKSPFQMELYANEVQSNEYQIKAIVSKTAPIPDEDYILHLMVTESHIPEQWQVLDELNFLLRDVLPDTNGTVLELQNNTSQVIEVPLSLYDEWVKENLEVVAFVQNPYSQKILQGINGKLLDLPTIVGEKNYLGSEIKLIPNPFKDNLQVQLKLKKAGNVSLELYNILGCLVATYRYNGLSQGDHLLDIQNADQFPRLSFCKIKTAAEEKCVKLIHSEGY